MTTHAERAPARSATITATMDESPTHPPPAATLRLGGVPCVAAGGVERVLEVKDALLLAWLAIEGPTPRARLAALLFPEADDARARNSLRQRLFQLRRKHGLELVGGDTLVALAPAVAVDVAGDELLAGIDAGELDELADWLQAQRRRSTARQLEALAAAAERAEISGDFSAALEHATALLQAQPESEHAHRRLMRLHYLRGDRASALAAFDHCRATLQRTLGIAPSAETTQLRDEIARSGGPLPVARRGSVPATLLRPPRLIGRDEVLAQMHDCWSDGTGFLIQAEAGLGKSRVLHEFIAGRADIVSLQARPGEAGVAYAVIARLLQAVLPRVESELSAERRRALGALLPALATGADSPAPGAVELRQAVLAALTTALARGLGGLVVDDLHFADDASSELLFAILEDESLAPLQIGLAQRPGGSSARQALERAQFDERRLVPLALPPLTREQIAALVDSFNLPGLRGAELAAPLLRHTGGNPMFLLETLKSMDLGALAASTHAAAPRALPRSTTVGALIERRLRQLSAPALALARVCAIAAIDFTPELATHVLQVRAVDLADPWAELEEAQILHGAAFAHDLVYEATLATIPLPVAGELHAAVAEFLEARGGEAARIGQHWLQARQGERAVPHLEQAAASALSRFQRPLAATHLEQMAAALAAGGNRSGAFRAQAELCSLLQGFDSGERHAQATETLLALAQSDAECALARTQRAVYLLMLGKHADSLALVEQAEADARAAQDDTALGQALNLVGIIRRRTGDLAGAREAQEAALAAFHRSGSEADLPAAHNNLGLVLLDVDECRAAVEQFERSARLQPDPVTRARVQNNLALALEELGQLEVALDTRQRQLTVLASQQGTDLARTNLLISLANTLRNLQRHGEALQALESAEQIAAARTHWRRDELSQQRASVFTELGAWRQVDEALAVLDREGATDRSSRLRVLLVRARLLLARGQDAAALVAEADALLDIRTDRRFERRLRVLQARTLAPAAALALAQQELAREAVHANYAAMIPFWTVAAAAALQLAQAAEAQRHATAATEALRVVRPLDFSPFEVQFVHAQAAAVLDAGRGAALHAALARHLVDHAERHVPHAHRAGFLRGLLLHRRILQAADARPRQIG